LKKDHPSRRSEAHIRTGASQPVTAVAAALPADPSRARPEVAIHHHGSDAATAATPASTLRSVSFKGIVPAR
jgi:hypothetical protein